MKLSKDLQLSPEESNRKNSFRNNNGEVFNLI